MITIAGTAFATPKQQSICPERSKSFVNSVQVFDGPVADLAILVPDEAKPNQGFWKLDYVYAAGRTVNVRCEYADKTNLDINLPEKIQKCSYRIDAKKKLKLFCD
ncbi:MAG: hypothetical protein EOO03_17465 [Chitinophagaceae bacterium]|nr:MAG: hypothetical protein EOO03_17465 [Chitinophagaceae bacterium]